MQLRIKTQCNFIKKKTMKKVILNSLVVLGILSGLSSCDKTEGTLYSGEPNKISFFTGTTSLAMEGGKMEIPVGRTSSAGELSLPITLTAEGTGYTDVFKVDGPVTFADGQAKSYATITYGDFSKIDPSTLAVTANGNDVNVGLAFPLTLNIGKEDVSPANVSKININASNTLSFAAEETVEINSIEGWGGDTYDISVQKAEGVNVYKVVSPYGANSFAFMIQSDGKTVVCPDQVIDNHPSYGPVSMTGVKGSVVNGVVTLEVTAYRVSAGSFGGGVEIIKLPN